MKIALVHELLTMRGGAERMLRIFAEMFPDAPIYTLLYDEEKLGNWFQKNRIRTASFSPPYSLLPTPYRFNHHLYLRQFPRAVEAWDFSDFDLVLSSSSALVHGIITNGKPRHICYVHSPARHLWDRTLDVLEQASTGIFGPFKRWYLEHLFHKLRIWDSEAADRPDSLLAPSKEVQRRIELYWRRESEIIHPPIDDVWIRDTGHPLRNGTKDYFFIASTLAPYKRIDIAIEACNRLKLPLKIAGEGSDRKRLERLAGSTIAFLGHKNDNELKELYRNAKATIFPGHEDFGLVPLESMACGTPVIAYARGGALETILENKTGLFFDEPIVESLTETLYGFEKTRFDPALCQEQAKKFSREKFEKRIKEIIQTSSSAHLRGVP